ncbi:hypothetical protein GCM10010924_53760 [Rhizobium wenxiniae]|nr:hypothetical protein [Rhizobium wenxiniae]GGG17877.1 hypothetical protein GCM10010924_53760 [Rhizobium wenxiniae]
MQEENDVDGFTSLDQNAQKQPALLVLSLLDRRADLQERLGLIDIDRRISQATSLRSEVSELSHMADDIIQRRVESLKGEIYGLELEIKKRNDHASKA